MRARLLAGLRRLPEALRDVDTALAAEPQVPHVLELRAWILRKMGRAEEATEVDALRAELDPTTFVASRPAPHDARRLVVDTEALELLERAEALAPGQTDARYWMGRVYLHRKAWDEAEREFRKQIEHDPLHFESYRNLDYVLARSRDWDAIVALWDRFLRLQPNHAAAYLERAGTNRHRGELEASLADLKAACRLGNEEACAIASRGYDTP